MARGYDKVRRSRRQRAIRYIPVDRRAPGRQARRMGAKSPSVFTIGAEDREGLENQIFHKVRLSFVWNALWLYHDCALTRLELRSDRSSMEHCSNQGKYMERSIAIVGAGLGGLAFARVLHIHGIESIVYEADPGPDSRIQGGQLDIHDYNGQIALQAAGLSDAFRLIIHDGAEAMRVLCPDGSVLLDVPDDGEGRRPEVLRGDLRKLLLDSLPETTVRWGKKLIDVSRMGDGHHDLLFADGSSERTDLLVGADGAWSKVRPLVSDAAPQYVGSTFLETYLYDADSRHAASAVAVGAGAMYVPSPGKALIAHREIGNVLHTYVGLKRPAAWFAGLDFNDPAAIGRIAAEFSGWAPALTALITDSDTVPVARMLYTLPTEHSWKRVPGVTLLGDAAHLMPPSGEGANLAMLEGAELAKAIVQHPTDMAAALSIYEKLMFSRAAVEGADAHVMLDRCLGDNAPSAFLDLLMDAPGPELARS